MKTVTNLLAFGFATGLILAIFGLVAKLYWAAFMFGWGLI